MRVCGGGGYVELSTDNFVFGWLKMGRLVTQWVYRKIYSAHSQEKQILQLKKKTIQYVQCIQLGKFQVHTVQSGKTKCKVYTFDKKQDLLTVHNVIWLN